MKEQKFIEQKIRKLLDHADSVAGTPEADGFNQKAEELMRRHNIDVLDRVAQGSHPLGIVPNIVEPPSVDLLESEYWKPEDFNYPLAWGGVCRSVARIYGYDVAIIVDAATNVVDKVVLFCPKEHVDDILLYTNMVYKLAADALDEFFEYYARGRRREKMQREIDFIHAYAERVSDRIRRRAGLDEGELQDIPADIQQYHSMRREQYRAIARKRLSDEASRARNVYLRRTLGRPRQRLRSGRSNDYLHYRWKAMLAADGAIDTIDIRGDEFAPEAPRELMP